MGVAGVAGNGQTELAELIAGILPVAAGSVRIGRSRRHPARRVRERREAGLAYIPDDRFRRGLAADASIADNLVMGVASACRRSRAGRASIRGAARRIGRELVGAVRHQGRLGVGPGARRCRAATRSALVIARELAGERPAIVAAQPTRGIDIAASRFVHDELLARRAAGAGILLISADLTEILALADRIVVLFAGRLMGEVAGGGRGPRAAGPVDGGHRRPARRARTGVATPRAEATGVGLR